MKITPIRVVAILAALLMSTYTLGASFGWVALEAPSLQVVENPGEGTAKSHVKMVKTQAGQIEKALIDVDILVDLVDPQTGQSLESKSIRISGLDLTEAGDRTQAASVFFKSTVEALDAQLGNVGSVLDKPMIEGMQFILNDAGNIISVPLQVNFRLTVISTTSTGAVEDALKGKGQDLPSGTALYDTRVRYTLEGLAYTEMSPNVASIDTLTASIETGVLAAFPDQF